MNKNQKGFGLIEGLLIIVVLGVVGTAGWYVWHQVASSNKKNSADTATPTPSPPAKKAPATPPADETASWTPYSSKLGQFSLRYPSSWVQPTNQEICNAGFFDRGVSLAPDKESVLRCGSEFFGQMSVGSGDGDNRSNFKLDTAEYDNIVETAVTAGGVAGKRISGVAKPKSEEDVFSPVSGTIEVHYVFYTNGITYYARYTQAPKGYSTSTDVLKDFDTMIKSTLKFSS